MAKKNSNQGQVVAGIGAGLAALAATVAGAYFLYGSKGGAKRRAKIKGWAMKAKGEVLEKLELAKEINEEVYQRIVDEVTAKYKTAQNVIPEEVEALSKELKSYWKQIQKKVSGKPAPRRRPARRRAKKAAA